MSLAEEAERHWVRLTLLAWALVAVSILWSRYGSIYWLALGDTDDNMRLMQVRALLNGQRWFDLRNHRLNPPVGFDIHWSRLVDLPIAGLILALRPIVGPVWAERWACGIAPLLPLSLAMLGVGATVRRLVSPVAWPAAILFLMCCPATLMMFMPERIDHHGWQLAMLSLTVAGLCDPARRRGGALVGIASAASLTIGLEMLPYAAMAGGILALRWVWDRAEAVRLEVYALTLSAGSAIGYAGFQGWDSSVLRCDALTPVWLTAMILAGGFLFLLARLDPASRALRLALAVAAGAIVAAAFAHAFPQCLGRPEQVSPELERNWLNNVREAKPIYRHPFRAAFPIVALPVVGVIGAAFATWRARGAALRTAWVPVLLFDTFAALMLLWQARAGPAAQLLAVPGVTALAWWLIPWVQRRTSVAVRVLGTAVAFLLVSGLFAGLIVRWLPIDRPKAFIRRVDHATGLCLTRPALEALNRYPAQTVFTFIDLGPRLVTITHHDAVAGPYHRNGPAILDVQHAFSRSPAEARAIMRRHGATLLLVCPDMAESTNYRARAPGGFYDQLAHGRRFSWLRQLPLVRGDPLRVWRID
ncbi:AcrB/AcrD/AcrF family protein [Sphingomonas bacterium]|uniref:AcrB/AcrD/AcrF family protein n=1 Tax=Sphingomonas bacterium TaxID=1895847 RepID=UPI0015754978|nr:AcrB/AcrD/AcrF family protein [Sphingomonas bacterium]